VSSTSDDDFNWPDMSYPSESSGKASDLAAGDRLSVERVPQDGKDGEEFYIQVRVSPKAVAVLVLLLTILSRVAEAVAFYYLNH
jgi:hypothetical protein